MLSINFINYFTRIKQNLDSAKKRRFCEGMQPNGSVSFERNVQNMRRKARWAEIIRECAVQGNRSPT